MLVCNSLFASNEKSFISRRSSAIIIYTSARRRDYDRHLEWRIASIQMSIYFEIVADVAIHEHGNAFRVLRYAAAVMPPARQIFCLRKGRSLPEQFDARDRALPAMVGRTTSIAASTTCQPSVPEARMSEPACEIITPRSSSLQMPE